MRKVLIYWIWLAEHPDLTDRQKQLLLTRFSHAEDIFFADAAWLADFDPDIVKALSNKDLTEPEKILRKCNQKGIEIITLADEAYPNRLKNITDPPLVLYYKGILPDFEKQPVIAVVGTRKATPYGITVTRRLTSQIAQCGGLVVSGGASGIDTAASRGALDAGCSTVAVLGCGVDVVYPKSNWELFATITKNGCLISEYPPQSRPERWHFPKRNRIISGIANGTLVAEAPKTSGALITARLALEQGRDVFVVPGNIDQPNCEGSNSLLQEGGAAVLSGWDIMKEYEAQFPNVVSNQIGKQLSREIPQNMVKVAQPLAPFEKGNDKKDIDNPLQSSYSGIEISTSEPSDEEARLLSCIGDQPKHMDDVIAASGMPAGRVLSMLTKMAIKGQITNLPGRMVSAAIRRK